MRRGKFRCPARETLPNSLKKASENENINKLSAVTLEKGVEGPVIMNRKNSSKLNGSLYARAHTHTHTCAVREPPFSMNNERFVVRYFIWARIRRVWVSGVGHLHYLINFAAAMKNKRMTMERER